ncbi:MAG: ribosomal protein L13e [Candidatus Bathyarchaeia archaeon]
MKPQILKRPIVKYKGVIREGKGFSLSELKEAGLTIDLAKKLGIAIDKRRSSLRRENVEILKELIKKS